MEVHTGGNSAPAVSGENNKIYQFARPTEYGAIRIIFGP